MLMKLKGEIKQETLERRGGCHTVRDNVDTSPKGHFRRHRREHIVGNYPWEIPWMLLENTLLFQGFMIHYHTFPSECKWIPTVTYYRGSEGDWVTWEEALPSHNYWWWPSRPEALAKMSFVSKIVLFRVKILLTFSCQDPESSVSHMFHYPGDKV